MLKRDSRIDPGYTDMRYLHTVGDDVPLLTENPESNCYFSQLSKLMVSVFGSEGMGAFGSEGFTANLGCVFRGMWMRIPERCE